MSWLNVKGNRELKLKENLNKWADHITGGMRKRLSVSWYKRHGVQLN